MTLDRYRDWLAIARRYAMHGNDAEDLLQDALLAAFRAQRQPLVNEADAPWFHGVIRNLAAMRARSAVRARHREHAVSNLDSTTDADLLPGDIDMNGLAALPGASRQVLLLALNGMDRAEICKVLGISDTALRQRLTALRKQLPDIERLPNLHALAAAYASRMETCNPPGGGLRRAALARGPSHMPAFRFGSADPDGHTFAISTMSDEKNWRNSSQNAKPRQQDEEPDVTTGESDQQEGDLKC